MSYEPVITVTITASSTMRFASRDYYDASDNFYKGSLVNVPELKESLPDLFYGAEYNQSVTVEIANGSSDLDDNWYTIANSEELRGLWISIGLIDESAETTMYTGKISQYEVKRDRITLSVDMRHDIILDTLLPDKVITTTEFDSTAKDVGQPINICFGTCRKVPLYNIRWDAANEIYDFLIGFGPIEKIGIYPGSDVGVIRGNCYIYPDQYTFYDGSQASPYPGYAFIRFTREQVDYSNNRYEMMADVQGLKLGQATADRNFADCIKALLSDPIFGLGDNCDETSFSNAASNLPTTDYMCDGAIVKPTQARDILNQMLLPARNSYIYRGADGEWEISVPGTGSSVATFGDNDGYYNNCEVVSVSAPSVKNSIKKIHVNFGIASWGDQKKTGDYWTGATFGTYKNYDLKFVDATVTVMKFFSLITKLTTFDRRITLYCGLEARSLVRGNIITVIAPDKSPLQTGKDWIVENIVRLPSFQAGGTAKYEIVGREYDPSLYDDLTGGTTTDLDQDDRIINGPVSMVGPITLGDGNQAGSITLTGSDGDIYIAGGKTNFDNSENGFILGIDHSDSDKAKFYIGNTTKFLNWDGINWTLKAGNFQFDEDGNILATNATLTGTVTADSGQVGGWTISASKLAAGQIEIDSVNKRIRVYSGDNYVELSQSGLIGYSSELGETVNVPIDGSPPTFSAGVIKDATHQLYTTGVIKTAESGRRILINSNGIQLLTGATTGKYSSFKYGDGTKYGSGAILKLHNYVNKIPLEFLTEQNVGDVGLIDRVSDPSGEASVGDIACVDGQLKMCTIAGTPGVWDEVGADNYPDLLMLGGM